VDELDDKALAGLRELLSDAESCARLSQWEEEFLSDMRDRVVLYGADTRVSDAQWKVLHRIEGKVYA
jgi:hypothetical protein